MFFFLYNCILNSVLYKVSNKKEGIVERIISTPINQITVDGEEINLSFLELKFILKHSQQIVKMKLIVLVGIIFDVITFLLIGFIL